MGQYGTSAVDGMAGCGYGWVDGRGLSHTALLSLPRHHTGAGAAGTPGLKQEVDMGHLYAMEWVEPPGAQEETEMETTILATKEEESVIAWL